MNKQLPYTFLAAVSLISGNAMAFADIDFNDIDSIIPEVNFADLVDYPERGWEPIWINDDCSFVVGDDSPLGFPIGRKFKIMDSEIDCSLDSDYQTNGGAAITLGGIGNTLSLNGTKLNCFSYFENYPYVPVPTTSSSAPIYTGLHTYGYGNKVVGNHSENGEALGPRGEILGCDVSMQLDNQIPTSINVEVLEAEAVKAQKNGLRTTGTIVERVNVSSYQIGFNVQRNNVFLADNQALYGEYCVDSTFGNKKQGCPSFPSDYFDPTGSGFVVGNSAEPVVLGETPYYQVKNILLLNNVSGLNENSGFVSLNQLDNNSTVFDISIEFRGNDAYENDMGFFLGGTGNNLSGRKGEPNTAELNDSGIAVSYLSPVTSPGGYTGFLNIISRNELFYNYFYGISLYTNTNVSPELPTHSILVSHNKARDNSYLGCTDCFDYYDSNPAECATTPAQIAGQNWWSNNAGYFSTATGSPPCTLISHFP